MTLERVEGAANASRSPVENMGVDHGRLHIAMTQKLLDRSPACASHADRDIVTPFQQVSGEGMPEGMPRAEARETLWCGVVHYAAVLTVTCMPALVARVMSISRLNLSHLPLVRSETLD